MKTKHFNIFFEEYVSISLYELDFANNGKMRRCLKEDIHLDILHSMHEDCSEYCLKAYDVIKRMLEKLTKEIEWKFFMQCLARDFYYKRTKDYTSFDNTYNTYTASARTALESIASEFHPYRLYPKDIIEKVVREGFIG